MKSKNKDSLKSRLCNEKIVHEYWSFLQTFSLNERIQLREFHVELLTHPDYEKAYDKTFTKVISEHMNEFSHLQGSFEEQMETVRSLKDNAVFFTIGQFAHSEVVNCSLVSNILRWCYDSKDDNLSLN